MTAKHNRVVGLPAVLRRDAPDFINLRKALRAAIVAPLVLVIGMYVLDDDTLALYGVLASIVALVFADYGGPAQERARAYLVMLARLTATLALGAALCSSPVAAVVGMFVIGFAATFASALGGYAPLHVSGMALAYSLSVLQPLTVLGVGDRIAGWVLGVGVSVLAALVLWPIDRRTGLRLAATELVGDLAETLASLSERDGSRRLKALGRRVDDLHQKMATPLRPFGAASRDIAMFHLVEHLENAVDLVGDLVADDAAAVKHDPLLGDVADALERTRDVLAGERLPAVAVDAVPKLGDELQDARRRVERAAASAGDGAAGLAVMTSAVPLLSLAHLSLWIEFEAARAVSSGREPPPHVGVAPEVASAAAPYDVRSVAARSAAFLRWELDSGGVIFRNSIRAGVALAAAVALAEMLGVEHGFWIVLATLLVLRSNAASTSAIAVWAVVGTIAGFAAAVLIIELAGDSDTLLWIVFPIAVFLSGYTPGALGIGVGQATFAVNVIILFSLTNAPGIETAFARVEDVTIGAVSAAALSLVMWPRGARAVLARAVADAYRAAAAATSAFVDGSADARKDVEQRLIAARRRAEAALDAAITEHGEPISIRSWVSILRPLVFVRAPLVPTVSTVAEPCAQARDQVRGLAEHLGRHLSTVADYLDGDESGNGSGADSSVGGVAVPPQALYACVSASGTDERRLFIAMTLDAWALLIAEIDRDLAVTEGDLRSVVAASRPNAWLVVAAS
jgi:uncharacterized membrane protein YccC